MLNKMEKTVFYIFTLLTISCKGLELTLDRNVIVTPGTRPLCGIVVCLENIHAAGASLTLSSDKIDSTPALCSISSMTMSKRTANTLMAKADYQKSDMIVSLSTRTPSLFRVSNGIKVDGLLTAERATLRLELFKQDDCNAEFTCQVNAVDCQDKELVIISKLMQQPQARENRDWNDGQNLFPVNVIVQLVNRLDAKLADLENYENDMNHFQDKFEYLERRFENKTDGIADKIESLNENYLHALDALENRLESKMGSTERNLQNNLTSLREFFVDEASPIHNILEKASVNQSENDAAQKVCSGKEGAAQEREKSVYNDVLETLKALGSVQNVKTEGLIQDFVAKNMKILQSGFSNITNLLTAEMTLDTVVNMSSHISCDLCNELESLQNSLNISVMKILSAIKAGATKTEDHIQSIFFHKRDTFKSIVESVMIDILSPKSCRKGMATILPLRSLPHPVVYPENGSKGSYLCDTVTDGGGWIIIQRRSSGEVDFYRNWTSYKNGFGSFDNDFWLGNEYIHTLTSKGLYELRVDMQFNTVSAFAHYATFSLGDESSNYALHLGPYNGTAGDSLGDHNGRPFSTFDRDNDGHTTNCAERYIGAWWYNSCHSSNLNGLWRESASKGPRWLTFSLNDAVTFSEMKIRMLN
ncbi:tenascin-r [Plakobranchus ocellatus]|uniref:Tenascin-r n=1 Tax=Plakobranchus ocellatus TaxID=259542 RepID=A0AAV4A676_9GAST|nr:tenascin-r [Plakobranchus ocellatus]